MIRAVCAFLLLGLSAAFAAETAKPLTTILIVAREDLPDDNFRDAVVLVMNNLGAAPAGVIINRPTRIPVSHLFPDRDKLAHTDAKLYFGGPVNLTAVSYLFRADSPPGGAVEVADGIYFGTSRELLLQLLDRDKPMEGLRIFVGYSGWEPGQLENEIARGDWRLERASAGTIFDAKPQHPWPDSQGPEAGRRI
ncbi:MAG TPA: YqgE/AlgH family protein [Casimicrobiaceae bacterium]